MHKYKNYIFGVLIKREKVQYSYIVNNERTDVRHNIKADVPLYLEHLFERKPILIKEEQYGIRCKNYLYQQINEHGFTQNFYFHQK